MYERAKPRLEKRLGLFEATVYGIGIILGAGIYAIIGKGAGLAGNAIWLSFLIAAGVAALTGLSYAELSSMYPRTAAEYHYTKSAFNRRGLSFAIGWIMIIAGLVSSAAVALGFAGYFSHMFGTPIVPVAIALIGLLSLLSFIGMKESARFNIVATLIEFSGLLIIIALGAGYIGAPGIDYLESPGGLAGIMGAVTLIFFAFIGFEGVANISEETRDAARNIPKALLIALGVSTLMYILVSLSAVSVLGWEGLSASGAPLTSVAVEVLGPGILAAFSIIALFATGNTVLIMLIVVSRMLYGMARDEALPNALARLHHRRKTPHLAILAVFLAASGFAALGRIELAAMLTDIGIFTVYLFVNLSLVRLAMKGRRGMFRVPGSLGRVPILPVLGAASCVVMLAFFEPLVMLAEVGVVVLGYIIFRIGNKLGWSRRGLIPGL